MLHLDFLAAADGTTLTKQFTAAGGSVEVDPYPNVKWLDSHREEITSVEDFYEALRHHAGRGHTLLKGNLRTPLKNESRAGMTTADAPTRWICLDLDFEEGFDSIADLLTQLHPGWADVSYVFQHSASAGVTSKAGLRGHIFLLLDRPVSPATMRTWLIEANLRVPGLRAQLELSASQLVLRWPLDITTCQNDKLIFIAPPVLRGLSETIDERIILVQGSKDLAPAPRPEATPAALEYQTAAAIAELREQAGLPKIQPRYQQRQNLQILINPDKAVVTGVKAARGFVYLNLNGGDSWGYYFPQGNPEIVYNFKGEPPVRLMDIDPEFAAQYQTQADAEHREAREQLLQGRIPYAFRDPTRDVYYNVLYNKAADEIDLFAQCRGKDRLQDFFAFHMTPFPGTIEDWTVVFDPSTTEVIRPTDHWINVFEPTDYIRFAASLTPTHQIPPVIDAILTSVTGSDLEAKEYFINWLAHIFQTRQRTNTAWVFQGIEGTGKGLTVSRILKPLMGPKHVIEWTNAAFEDQFNAPLEHGLILHLDEFRAASAGKPEAVMARLRNLITEDRIAIRAMRQNTVFVPNYLNVIIATNQVDPIHIETHDRRFNVAPPQLAKLILTPEQIDSIDLELPAFASFLHNFQVDARKVRIPLENEAKRQAIASGHNSVKTLFERFRQGDLEWFLGYLSPARDVGDLIAYQRYEEAVLRWAREYLDGPDEIVPVRVPRDELNSVYNYLHATRQSPAKFTRTCHFHRIRIDPIRIDGRSVRGTETLFTGSRGAIEAIVQDYADRNNPPNHLKVIK